jgi:aminoglycoside phosphotransferase (APT) family kinase protein
MPDLPPELDLLEMRARAEDAHPELAGLPMSILSDGWDSVAVDVDDRFILKFPRHAAGEAGLRHEAVVLGVIRPAVAMPLADLHLHELPVPHSLHHKLPGVSLLPALYHTLAEPVRDGIADRLGHFFAQLHAIDPAQFRALGVGPVEGWLDAAAIRDRALGHLPATLRPWADRAFGQWADLPPDPLGTVFGHFDAHGWNMAFDPPTQKLSVFDFGDSGFGPVHREFVYSSLVSPDLTTRIIDAYGRHSGRQIDRERVWLLADIHRLWEIAVEADDAGSVAAMLPEVESWARQR